MSTLQAFGQLVSNIEKYLSVSYSHDFVNMFPLPFALKKKQTNRLKVVLSALSFVFKHHQTLVSLTNTTQGQTKQKETIKYNTSSKD